MFEEFVDKVTKKTMKKSAKTVKKEVKRKVDEVTTGENGQKLLIAACLLSSAALIFSLFQRNSKPVIVNIYNK